MNKRKIQSKQAEAYRVVLVEFVTFINNHVEIGKGLDMAWINTFMDELTWKEGE